MVSLSPQRSRWQVGCCVVMVGGALVVTGQASKLDWNQVDWPSASDTEARFVNVDGSGIDVEVIFTGDLGSQEVGSPGGFSPQEGGGPGGSTVLSVGVVNWDGLPPDPNISLDNALQVTLNFYYTGTEQLAPLADLWLIVGDVDANYFGSLPVSYNDQLTFSGTPTITDLVTGTDRTTNPHFIDGATVQAWSGALPYNGVSAATPDGNFAGGGLPTTDEDGYLNVSYSDGGPTYSYVHTNGPGTQNNPLGQLTTMGTITFNALPPAPVPEPGALALALAGLAALAFRRNR